MCARHGSAVVCLLLTMQSAIVTGCFATSATGHVNRGDKLYKAGRYSEAADEYRKAAKKSPKLALAYVRLGRAEAKLHKGPEAVEAFRRAIELMPPGHEDAVQARIEFASIALSDCLNGE